MSIPTAPDLYVAIAMPVLAAVAAAAFLSAANLHTTCVPALIDAVPSVMLSTRLVVEIEAVPALSPVQVSAEVG